MLDGFSVGDLHDEKKEEGLPAASPVLTHVGPFPINSSMVLTWFIAAGIIIFARIATRSIKQVPPH